MGCPCSEGEPCTQVVADNDMIYKILRRAERKGMDMKQDKAWKRVVWCCHQIIYQERCLNLKDSFILPKGCF